MRKTMFLVTAFAILCVSGHFWAGYGGTSNETQTRDYTQWITRVLKEIQTIKIGMTRRDFLRVFTEEGGVSTHTQRTYVYHECPYIKVDVKFKPNGNDQDKLHEQPEDVIVDISRPYLQWSVGD